MRSASEEDERARTCPASAHCFFLIEGAARMDAKVEPWPAVDSTQIFPPCISMIRFEIASPRPVPPFLRVIELSACLLQRFAQLVEQPRVFNGNDGLLRKIAHQLDLLACERPHLLAIDGDCAEQRTFLEF